MNRWFLLCAFAGMAAFAGPATAIPPSLVSVSQSERRPAATFTAPNAGVVTAYLATDPGRATDGFFFREHAVRSDLLESAEISSGVWRAGSQLEPGTYWMMLRAEPDIELCPLVAGARDPACASGFSEVLPLEIPTPAIRFRTGLYRLTNAIDLTLTATPLGERLPYQVCYRNRLQLKRCKPGVLYGTDWETAEDDTITIRTANLPRTATFTWHAGGEVIATRRVRIR